MRHPAESNHTAMPNTHNDTTQPTPGMADASDRQMFYRTHKAITGGKLYLDPTFSRRTYLKLCPTNKNKVAMLMRRYAGTNLNGYINAMRLAYAEGLMRTRPDLPIKAVALESGFSSLRTFYRLFMARYGMTPTTYRKSLCSST